MNDGVSLLLHEYECRYVENKWYVIIFEIFFSNLEQTDAYLGKKNW
jgi:hypothetical protein